MEFDTIFALASGAGRGGVAIIRLSGPQSGPVVKALGRRSDLTPRYAHWAVLRHPKTDEILDDGLILFFPGPASFTGEDVAELHIHGGRATIAAFIDCLATFKGVRSAEPGEFTRRAFENGKMDLTAAEGLADLVDAETAAQRRQALRQMKGELGDLYESWRHRLIRALAHAEAAIDFAEEDIPEDLEREVKNDVAQLLAELRRHLDDKSRGERLRDGIHMAIIGAPNAGKSSLLNRLARRDAAIVSATAGTTRDVVEVRVDIGGYPVTVADTAGLRLTSDEIEEEGVKRAKREAREADLKIAMFDAADHDESDGETLALLDDHTVVVLNKIDLATGRSPLEARIGTELPVLKLSAKTGEGLNALMEELERQVEQRWGLLTAPSLTRQRHRVALEECAQALDRYFVAGLAELAAEDLRLAMRALGRITGRVDVEDLLDVIFRDFCIGK